MSQKRMKTIAIVVAVVMLLGIVAGAIVSTVYADPTDAELNQIDDLRDRRDAAQQGLEGARQERALSLAELNAINNQVAAAQNRVAQTQSELAGIEYRLSVRTAELEYAIARADEQDRLYGEHLRIMISGSPTYLQTFVNADNFSDLTTRTRTTRAIARHDEYILNNMWETQEEIAQARAEIEIEQANHQEVLARQQSEQAVLVQQQSEQQRFVDNLQRDINAFQRVYDQARQEEDALIRSIQSRMSTAGDGTFVGGTFLWPVPGRAIGSGAGSRFGYRIHPITGRNAFHGGIDIPAPSGTNIIAANAGTVIFSGWNGGFGNCIIIDHGGGYATLYAHNSANLVRVGQQVYRGQVIARVGSTGNSTGPHLHFEVHVNGRRVNPMNYF